MNVPMLLYTRNFPEGMFVDLSETNLIHAQMSESLHSLGGIGHNKHSERIKSKTWSLKKTGMFYYGKEDPRGSKLRSFEKMKHS